jgi:hypothetical protein
MPKTTITLKYPIEFAGRTIEKIEMRRAKAKDVTQANKLHKGDNEVAQLHLLACLTETEPEALENLDMADYKQLTDTLEGFLS